MNAKIKKIVEEAYNTVPMYYKIKDKENLNIEYILQEDKWSELPIIDKSTVVLEGNSSITSTSIPLLLSNKLISARTSGSTGKYMEIYWNKGDYNKSMLPLWYYRNKYYGIKPDDKMCFFFTIHKLGEEDDSYIYEKNTLGFSKSNLDIDKLAKIYMEIKEYAPKWLLLQPSIGVLLCECMDRLNLAPLESVKYIEFSGEILADSVRKEIDKHFKCKIADMYGANEFNGIAYQCPCGNMHILSDNVYVEEDLNGELLITTRTNKAMPLIRYRIGDIGKILKDTQCQCGNKNDILKLTSGRANDFILCKGGEKRTPYVLVRAIECVNHVMEGVIKQFQIEQMNIGKFIIRLVVDMYDEMYDQKVIEDMFKKFIVDEELRKTDYIFEYYEELFPDEVSGKHRYFINNKME